MNTTSTEKRRRTTQREWIVPAVVLGALILLTTPELRTASGQSKVFVLPQGVSEDCEKLKPFIGVRTDQFEVLGMSWAGERDSHGLCMIDVQLSGYGAVSATHFYQFLRDAVGIPETSLEESFNLDRT